MAPDDRPAGVVDVDLLFGAFETLDLAGEYRRAVDFGREALRREDARDVDRVRAASIRARLAVVEWRAGDLEASIALCEEARTLVAHESASEGRASLGAVCRDPGGCRTHETGDRDCERGDRRGGRSWARLIEGRAKTTKGGALSTLGECEAGIPLLEEALAITIEVNDPEALCDAYTILGAALFTCGDTDGANAKAREGAEVARRLGMWRTVGVFLECNMALGLFETGRWAEAVDVLDRSEPYAMSGVVRTCCSTLRCSSWCPTRRPGRPPYHR